MWPKLMEEHNGPLCFLLGNNKRCLTQKNTIVVAARGGRAHARLGITSLCSSDRERKLKGLSVRIAAHASARKKATGTCAEISKKIGPFLDLCVSSLRRGHANLLCIVPILSDVPEGMMLDAALFLIN